MGNLPTKPWRTKRTPHGTPPKQPRTKLHKARAKSRLSRLAAWDSRGCADFLSESQSSGFSDPVLVPLPPFFLLVAPTGPSSTTLTPTTADVRAFAAYPCARESAFYSLLDILNADVCARCGWGSSLREEVEADEDDRSFDWGSGVFSLFPFSGSVHLDDEVGGSDSVVSGLGTNSGEGGSSSGSASSASVASSLGSWDGNGGMSCGAGLGLRSAGREIGEEEEEEEEEEEGCRMSPSTKSRPLSPDEEFWSDDAQSDDELRESPEQHSRRCGREVPPRTPIPTPTSPRPPRDLRPLPGQRKPIRRMQKVYDLRRAAGFHADCDSQHDPQTRVYAPAPAPATPAPTPAPAPARIPTTIPPPPILPPLHFPNYPPDSPQTSSCNPTQESWHSNMTVPSVISWGSWQSQFDRFRARCDAAKEVVLEADQGDHGGVDAEALGEAFAVAVGMVEAPRYKVLVGPGVS